MADNTKNRIEYEGGDKIKIQDSEFPPQNICTDKNLNDIRDAINNKDDRLKVLETGEINEIIQVSAKWTDGLNHDVTGDNFPIDSVNGKVYYKATPGVVTLETADVTFDRKDRIGLFAPIAPATLGTVGKITGDPSPNPIAKDYDPTEFFTIRIATVEFGQISPKGVNTILNFDEDVGEPTEWVYSSNSANIVVSTNNPFSGLKAIESTNQLKGNINTFSTVTPINSADIGLLTFQLRLKDDAQNSSIFIEFFNGAARVGSPYLFKTGENNYDSSIVGSYREIRIDGSKFNLPSSDIDRFQIYVQRSFLGYYLDFVEIHTGSGSDTIIVSGVEEAPVDGNLYARINKQWVGIPKEYGFTCSDESTDLVVDLVTPAYTDYLPFVIVVDEVYVNIGQEMPTGAKIEIDVHKNGTTIFDVKPTIDISEPTTDTASVAQVITGGSVTFIKTDKVEVFITQVGSTLPGKGLKCKLLQT